MARAFFLIRRTWSWLPLAAAPRRRWRPRRRLRQKSGNSFAMVTAATHRQSRRRALGGREPGAQGGRQQSVQRAAVPGRGLASATLEALSGPPRRRGMMRIASRGPPWPLCPVCRKPTIPSPTRLPVEPDDGARCRSSPTRPPGHEPVTAAAGLAPRPRCAAVARRCTIRGAPPGAGVDCRWFESGRSWSRCWRLLGFAAWASDFVTMQGERTVYTVDCIGGAWQGDRCSGQLAAGTRYRYRALKPHGEVIFWTVGTAEPSGKFSDCDDPGRPQLGLQGLPRRRPLDHAADGAGRAGRRPPAVTRPFRAVSKWRWLLLQRGFTGGPRRAAGHRRRSGDLALRRGGASAGGRAAASRAPSTPVASAVPMKMTTQPATSGSVSRSPRKTPPQTTAKIGIRYVTATAFAGPALAISRK